LISVHNYFIMHDIKYFFLNENNQTIREREGKLPKNIIFQNQVGKLSLNIHTSAPV
jgi:hypothetical protein